MIKKHTYIGSLERESHGDNDNWYVGSCCSLLSRSEHRDQAELDTGLSEKDPELCAVGTSIYLIWESLAPHLPSSGAQCSRNIMWQYLVSSLILTAKESVEWVWVWVYSSVMWWDMAWSHCKWLEEHHPLPWSVGMLGYNLVTVISTWVCLSSGV